MKNVFSPLITVLLLLICLSCFTYIITHVHTFYFETLASYFSCVIPEPKVQHKGNKASNPNQYDETFSIHRFDKCVDLQTNICRCIYARIYLEELLSFCLKDILQRLLHEQCGQCGKGKGDECTKNEHKRILL